MIQWVFVNFLNQAQSDHYGQSQGQILKINNGRVKTIDIRDNMQQLQMIAWPFFLSWVSVFCPHSDGLRGQ